MKKILCLALLSVGSTLFAAPVTGLFNTGVDNFGAKLVGGNGTTDPHYTVVQNPGGATNTPAVTYLEGAYVPETATARWISVNANGATHPSGTYIFQIMFNLGTNDPLAVHLTGNFAADNSATIKLNGVTIAGATSTGYTAFTPFTIGSNFVAGVNTLQFVVSDVGQPVALIVDNLAISGVPEPSAFALLFSGLALLSVRQFRKR